MYTYVFMRSSQMTLVRRERSGCIEGDTLNGGIRACSYLTSDNGPRLLTDPLLVIRTEKSILPGFSPSRAQECREIPEELPTGDVLKCELIRMRAPPSILMSRDTHLCSGTLSCIDYGTVKLKDDLKHRSSPIHEARCFG